VRLLLFTAGAAGLPATAAFAVAGVGVPNEARLVGVIGVGTAMPGRNVVSSSLMLRDDSLIVRDSWVRHAAIKSALSGDCDFSAHFPYCVSLSSMSVATC
jgi:nicotinamide mononucleotide (NMN) deamidase PncC